MGSSEKTWYVLGVNPRPWAIGPLDMGRNASGKLYPKVGRNQQLHLYKSTLASALLEEYPYLREYVDSKKVKEFPSLSRYAVRGNLEAAIDRSLWAGADVEMTFYFWQKLETAEVGKRKIKDKAADLTNMVKAAEDAVQGLLLNNDTQVRAQRNVIMQRDEDVPEGIVVISIEPFSMPDFEELPSFVWQRVDEIFRASNGEDGAESATLKLF